MFIVKSVSLKHKKKQTDMTNVIKDENNVKQVIRESLAQDMFEIETINDMLNDDADKILKQDAS